MQRLSLAAIFYRCLLLLLIVPTCLVEAASGMDIPGMDVPGKKETLNQQMTKAVKAFLSTLDADQLRQTQLGFDDPLRFDWHFVPRERKGLALKHMNDKQRAAAMGMVRVMMSDEGYRKIDEIIDLENVLRVVENRPPNDTRRDPENYSFLVFGTPGDKDPWSWRIEGHHISLHFSSVTGQLSYTPSFIGTNPGHVLADMPQKGRRVLKDEEDVAFQLLNALTEAQRQKVILGTKSPWEIFTANNRKADKLTSYEGIPMKDMTPAQQDLFRQLIGIYLNRYHVTLKNQQMEQLQKAGMENIYFAWIGNTEPIKGKDQGHYYRIHGPTMLIEFDNTQDNANHIHTVVRDLTNDFGDDLLRLHYEKAHKK
ncbi:DUF3500 domain-containing protein [Telluribacter sp. SYSU D00476]|uniref:DUF3500 domain-containing protein n=1 Tax=Telluribacter sp. SYSU D00476 TaxID=2811430 RepID=UPI001FF4EED2|nr:DUF3500 domain-containing protein [Telluribacter sp. SYSU D00476]